MRFKELTENFVKNSLFFKSFTSANRNNEIFDVQSVEIFHQIYCVCQF